VQETSFSTATKQGPVISMQRFAATGASYSKFLWHIQAGRTKYLIETLLLFFSSDLVCGISYFRF
jgi:hypothetical protein